MLEINSKGYIGIVHQFNKPFTTTFYMLIAMSFSLLVSKFWDPAKKKGSITTWKSRVMCSIPITFDIVSSTLATFGLMYVNASVFQMLRGFALIFVSILSVIFLKRRFKHYEWIGISLVVVSMILIGLSGINTPTNTNATHGQKVLGVILIIVAQFVIASCGIMLESILKSIGLTPMEVTGWEGVFGLLIDIFIFLPLAFIIPGNDPSPLGGSFENIWDSVLQISNSPTLIWMFFGYLVIDLVYNVVDLFIVLYTSCVTAGILDVLRTMIIWIVMLISGLFDAPFGEKWSKWSWIELGGFVLYSFSIFIYNGKLKLPFLTYEEE